MQVIAEAVAAKASHAPRPLAARRARARAERAVAVHCGEQRRHEAVACADRVDDIDLGRRDARAARRRYRRRRPARRASRRRSCGPSARPAGEACPRSGGRDKAIRRSSSLALTKLASATCRSTSATTLCAIRRHQRTDVGIETGRRATGAPCAAPRRRVAMPRVDGGDRADMQVRAPWSAKSPETARRRRRLSRRDRTSSASRSALCRA